MTIAGRIPSTKTLVIATGNAGKLAEFRGLLGELPLQIAGFGGESGSIQIEESGASYEENASIKAIAVAKHSGAWALGDDTGLELDALGGSPGLLTARFAGPNATAEANRAKLLALLKNKEPNHRTARFVCHLALADPTGTIRARASGCCRGRITHSPAGPQSFGYDSLFEVVEYRRTFAELGEAAKSCLTHRARAVQQLLPEIIAFVCGSGSA
jgi:XTP/dITP diphosphohydrolase